ncbi:MAG: LuxR C-terminal-related transcriptional regulator [Chitinophagales bacterium]
MVDTDALNKIEMEVLKLTASGYNIKQLCAKLGADEGTIEKHRQNILAKTSTRTMTDAVNEGTKKGWIYI